MTAKRKVVKEPIGGSQPETYATTPSQAMVHAEVVLIPHEVFQDKIRTLRGLATIRNDKGEDVDFEGEAKDDFVSAFEAGYPVLEKTIAGLYELGTFLHGVRAKLKPHKLYHTWLEYAGIPRGTAQSYVQAYVRYQDKLPRFAGLGIRKLLIASRLPDCAEYVEQHEREIESQTTEQLEKQVKRLRQRKRTKETKAGRKPTYVSIGSYRIRPSMDGSKITIEGMAKSEQARLIEGIKALLSQGKD